MALPDSATSLDNRYVIQAKLGEGGMGAVYRATDRLTGHDVALKQVLTSPADLMFGSRDFSSDLHLSLTQEFKILSSLRHPNIVGVLDYGFTSTRQPFLTMEFLDGAQTILEAAHGKSLAEKTDLTIQMLQALVYLHRRNVLHRDLKPANVLVVDGDVKVLDFGLSMIGKQSGESKTETTAGTFAYMAPEQFHGKKASRRSDLYAAGLIYYELLAERYPYSKENIGVMIAEIMNTPIDLDGLDLPEEVARVLRGLLEKDPLIRPDRASPVIADLSRALDLDTSLETSELRESFITAASFTGRDAELSQLSDELGAAFDGEGRARLVAGESGVGKTRLFDELRTLALVKGALVLRGGAVDEGGGPYEMWREIMRRLTIYADLSDEEAAQFKPFVADIETLIGREIPDPPPLDPQTAQARIIDTVRAVLSRHHRPVVLLLDDLQWARSESLTLLNKLAENAHESPRYILGNYRDDERPDLPEVLPHMATTRLERLTQQGISDLSGSMLGSAGREDHIVALLERETEGNPFFIVEVVRFLADRGGSLDEIATMTIPHQIFSGGIEEVVQRRLGSVPDRMQPLLQLAAVAGRKIDPEVLAVLAEDVDLDDWLAACADAAVLEAQGENWRFAHDKLRERVLLDLPQADMSEFHRRVAEAIETVHPEDPSQAPALARHWAVAGDAGKELHYAVLAGSQAFQNNANHEAVLFLSRALELLMDQPESPQRIQQELGIQLPLGFASLQLHGYVSPQARTAFTRAEELCAIVGDAPEVVPVLFGLCVYYEVKADYPPAIEYADQIIRLAPQTDDPALVRVIGHTPQAANTCPQGLFEEGLQNARIAIANYRTEQHTPLLLMTAHNLGIIARCWEGLALMYMGKFDEARATLLEAEAQARELDHPYTLGFPLIWLGFIYSLTGEWDALQGVLDEGVALATRYDYPTFLHAYLMHMGWLAVKQGRIDEGKALCKQSMMIIDAIGQGLFRPHWLTLYAEVYYEAGEFDKALARLDESLSQAEKTNERYFEAQSHHLRGKVLLAQGASHEQVEAAYQTSLQVAREQQAKTWELHTTLSLARLWQAQGKTSEARTVLSEIVDWFTAGSESTALIEARAFLAEL